MSTEITEETVRHVAKLARLALTSEEVTRYTQDLDRVLGLVAQLDALDLDGVDMTVSADEGDWPVWFREDEPQRLYSREALLANAPQEEDGFFRVPRILSSSGGK